MSETETPSSADAPLDSWKAIAAYLNRDARTVMRWEKSEGLPVHRHRHLARSSVYAYRHELDSWRARRRMEVPTPDAARPSTRWRSVPIAAALVMALTTAGDGRFTGGASATQTAPIDRVIPWPESARMAASAAMSPDGRYVSYVNQTTGELDLRDLRSSQHWSLTQIAKAGGMLDGPAFSHDGKLLAFASKDAGPPFVTGKLRVLSLPATQSSESRVLAEGQWFVPQGWSPDNKTLVVRIERNDRTVDIATVTVADGSMRLLKRFGVPWPLERVRLSPDGAFVAYTRRASDVDQHRDLFLLPISGGPEVPLLDGPSSDTVVGWSEDGRQLVFESDRNGSNGLWSVAVTSGRRTGEPTLLINDFMGDALTLIGGDRLFYEGLVGGAPERPLRVATVDPIAGTLITAPWFAAHDRQAFSRLPRWSADGKSFMYVTARPAGKVISIRSVEPRLVREVPLNLGYIWTFDWSPDGRWLVFRATDLKDNKGLFLVDAETGAVRPVVINDKVAGAFVPQFTADGKAVTFFKNEFDASDRPGWQSYVAWDIATGTQRVVHADIRELMNGRYPLGRSPDGRFLLASSEQPPGSALFAYDTTTHSTREIFRRDAPSAFNPENGLQWMPDSSAVVTNVRGKAANQRELWWVPLDGRSPHRLDIGVDDLVNSAIAIHPDGRQIAYLSGTPVNSKTTSPVTEFRLLERFLAPAGTKRP